MRRGMLIGLVGAAIVAGGALWTTTARAQNLLPSTGNDLIQHCGQAVRAMDGERKPNMDFRGMGFCQGLLRGVWDVSSSSDTPLYRRVCHPDTVNLEQAIRVVHKWLEDHPKRLHETSSWLVTEALARSWSCLEDTITGR